MSSTISYCVGIDLGSTTTKAVILDEKHRPLGRGITNSRSNYDVACQVALGEALIHARFALLRAELERGGVVPDRVDSLLLRFELAFREQQYRMQLGALRDELERQAGRTGCGKDVVKAIHIVIDQMVREAGELFRPGEVRKSDFFRDLAGSRYMVLAEEQQVRFDTLTGLFDKAILEVENSVEAVGSFDVHARSALAAVDDTSELETAVTGALAMRLQQVGSVGTGYGR